MEVAFMQLFSRPRESSLRRTKAGKTRAAHASLQAKYSESAQQAVILQQTLDKTKEELSQSHQSFVTVNQDLQDAKTQHAKALADAQDKLRGLQSDKELLTQDRDSLDDRLKKEQAKSAAKISYLEQSLEQSQGQARELKGQNENLVADLSAARAQYDALKFQTEQTGVELNTTHQSLTLQLHETKQKLEKSERELSQTQQALYFLTNDKSAVAKQLKEVEAQLEESIRRSKLSEQNVIRLDLTSKISKINSGMR
eukprot:m.208106 g.208106  ORF g.208106 m.208106 type:complete len:255 (-) comp53925_c0_seq5:748-1512(-)